MKLIHLFAVINLAATTSLSSHRNLENNIILLDEHSSSESQENTRPDLFHQQIVKWIKKVPKSRATSNAKLIDEDSTEDSDNTRPVTFYQQVSRDVIPLYDWYNNMLQSYATNNTILINVDSIEASENARPVFPLALMDKPESANQNEFQFNSAPELGQYSGMYRDFDDDSAGDADIFNSLCDSFKYIDDMKSSDETMNRGHGTLKLRCPEPICLTEECLKKQRIKCEKLIKLGINLSETQRRMCAKYIEEAERKRIEEEERKKEESRKRKEKIVKSCLCRIKTVGGCAQKCYEACNNAAEKVCNCLTCTEVSKKALNYQCCLNCIKIQTCPKPSKPSIGGMSGIKQCTALNYRPDNTCSSFW